jgi:hypothetical protein
MWAKPQRPSPNDDGPTLPPRARCGPADAIPAQREHPVFTSRTWAASALRWERLEAEADGHLVPSRTRPGRPAVFQPHRTVRAAKKVLRQPLGPHSWSTTASPATSATPATNREEHRRIAQPAGRLGTFNWPPTATPTWPLTGRPPMRHSGFVPSMPSLHPAKPSTTWSGPSQFDPCRALPEACQLSETCRENPIHSLI